MTNVTDVNNLLNAQPVNNGIKRDQYGRYLIPDPETGEVKAWTRATTLSSILDDAKGLETWNNRNIAFGLGRREDLFALAASVATMTEPDDKQVLDSVIASAKEVAGADSKANLGTALHNFTQRWDLGEQGVTVPDQWKLDIDAYLAGMKARALWPYAQPIGSTFERFIERVLIVPELETAGTADRFLSGDGFPDDLPVVGDLKTGKVQGKGRQFAVQLAIYAHASHWFDPLTNELFEMPKVNQDFGIVIHLPVGAGECYFYDVDLKAGWEAAQLAYQIHQWRKRNDLAVLLPEYNTKAMKAENATITPLDENGEPNGKPVELNGVKSVTLTSKLPDDSEFAPDEPKRKTKKTKVETERDAAVEKAKRGEPLARKTLKPECVDCGHVFKAKEKQNRHVDGNGEIFEPLCESDYVIRTTPEQTHRKCMVCPHEIPLGMYTEHNDKHLLDARFAYCRARVKYVIDEGRGDELGDLWANAFADIPTFKRGGPRTHDEIDRVAGMCSLVEMAHSMTFPDFIDPAMQKDTVSEWINGEKEQHEQRQLASS